ncbi:hypothetical protein TWF694_003224 [Orbilia ellipsospora]|uniref:F-box domain-containing protein n=1 Tax=Orbilia ellipsospora TaxID=2528407 RepID=A0AAV9X259_9PEZI
MSQITLLPVEIQTQILSYLPFYDQVHASRACNLWQDILTSYPFRYTERYRTRTLYTPERIHLIWVHKLFFDHWEGYGGNPQSRVVEFKCGIQDGRITTYMICDDSYTLDWENYDTKLCQTEIETEISQSPMLDEPFFEYIPFGDKDRGVTAHKAYKLPLRVIVWGKALRYLDLGRNQENHIDDRVVVEGISIKQLVGELWKEVEAFLRRRDRIGVVEPSQLVFTLRDEWTDGPLRLWIEIL